MTTIVSRIYKQGKIELLETPAGLRESRVRVVLTEEEEPKPAARYLEYGKYKVEGKDTPPKAFEEAEWHGEPEFDDLYGG
jgi:hypothetical protein